MLRVVFFILAGIVLVIGLIGGINLLTSSSYLAANAMLPLQLVGAGPAANMISSTVSGFLINLGITIILVSAIISLLLFGIGQLFGRLTELETRLAILERTQTNR